MRAFRDFLKKEFMEAKKSKYYYWIASTLREETKKFYISRGIDIETYSQNEFVFIRLIHNSTKGEETSSLPGIEQQHAQLLIDVFGAKPNTKNLKKFFSLDII
jgi:hypothetical protein